jgi:3-hydroxyisobutyrate dehydrogenase-like beta-hydroxyacid dehydrogenase
MPLQRIAVLGLGKLATLAAKLLHQGGFDVTGFDNRTSARSSFTCYMERQRPCGGCWPC